MTACQLTDSFSFYEYKYNKTLAQNRRKGMMLVHVSPGGLVLEQVAPRATLKSRLVNSTLLGLKKRRVIQAEDCKESRLLYNFIPLDQVSTRLLPTTATGTF